MNGHSRNLSIRGWRRVGTALLGVAALVGTAVVVLATSSASAAGTVNLGVAQFVSNGAGSGQTVITDHVHNSGPSTATSVVAVVLINTSSAALNTAATNADACQDEPAPPGWVFMLTCQRASIASGSTWLPKFTVTGTNGASLTWFLSVGARETDPTFSNNSSTLHTFLGSEADLDLSQAAKAGASAGKVTITATIRNHGPWTANALQHVTEINSPGFDGVLITSNVSSSCQFIPPASGFNSAVSCVTNVLAPRHSWVLTFAYSGTAGGSLVAQGKVSANSPADPVSSNNSATTTTHYRS
jgi:hypothetical protein